MTDNRNSDGTFRPGNKVRTDTAGKQQNLSAVMRSILSPEKAAEYWQQAWDVAYSRKSPRSMVQVLETGLNYAYGRPAQTIEVQNDATAWLAQLLADRTPALPPRLDDGDDVQLIDGEIAQLVDKGDTDNE